MNEQQGDRIIDLLEQILNKLDYIDSNLNNIDSNTGSLNLEFKLDDIVKAVNGVSTTIERNA